MYTDISQQTIDIIEGDGRCFRATLDFGEFEITSDKIYSFQTDGGSCADEDITFGGVFSQGVKVEVSEIPCPLEGRSFVLYVYLASFVKPKATHEQLSEYTHYELSGYTHAEICTLFQSIDMIPMGKYKVTGCKSKADGYTISASDFLAEADKEYKSSLTFPATTKEIEDEICAKLGIQGVARANEHYLTSDGESYITADDEEYVLYDYLVTIADEPEKLTMRQMLGLIASLRGCFAVSDRFGNLKYTWYKDSGYELRADRIDVPELEENDVTIGQIMCKISDNEHQNLYSGMWGRQMFFENPYMTRANINAIQREKLPFRYRAGRVLQRMGDPRIDVWDVLRYGDHRLPVMLLSFKFDGGFSAEIEATASTEI